MIDPDLGKKELDHYAWVLCSAEFYRGTEEGKMHTRDAFILKGCLNRLGLLTDEDDHVLWERARGAVKKIKEKVR